MDLQKYIKEINMERTYVPIFEKSSECAQYCINVLNRLVITKNGGKNGLILTEDLNTFYQQLFAYLNQDKRVEEVNTLGTKTNWSLDKGLFIAGGYGVGKTLILDFLREVKTTFQISGVHTNAYQITKEYAIEQQNLDYLGYREIVKAKNLFIDEVGDEPKVSKSYGNEENVIYRTLKIKLDLIESQRFPKDKIFLTTNLSIQELTERYGERVMDRIKGAMNVIIFNPQLKSNRE